MSSHSSYVVSVAIYKAVHAQRFSALSVQSNLSPKFFIQEFDMSQPPILLYTFRTPNGHPISIHLEELKAAYPGFGGYECVFQLCVVAHR